MNWLRKLFGCDHGTCIVCQVYFKPPTGFEARWVGYCSLHREPLVKDYQRREAAADWARSHPDQIEPLMATEKAVLNQQLGAALQAQQNASQQLYSGVLPDFGGIVRDGIL